MEAYNKSNRLEVIFSECETVDWYDGPWSGFLKLAGAEQWYLFNLCFFDPGEGTRIFSLIEIAGGWVDEIKSTKPTYDEVKNDMKKAYERYAGNAWLLMAQYIVEGECEIVEIPFSSVKYYDDIEDTFGQGQKETDRWKGYFNKAN